MKFLTVFLLSLLIPISSFSALLTPQVEKPNGRAELEVLPPLGLLGCKECENFLFGGTTKGPSAADLELYQEHVNIIYEGAAGSKAGNANSVDGG